MIITLLKVYILIGCITTIIDDLILRYVGIESKMILFKIIFWPVNVYITYVVFIKGEELKSEES